MTTDVNRFRRRGYHVATERVRDATVALTDALGLLDEHSIAHQQVSAVLLMLNPLQDMIRKEMP